MKLPPSQGTAPIQGVACALGAPYTVTEADTQLNSQDVEATKRLSPLRTIVKDEKETE